MSFIAALPMYDWPEIRAKTDAQWARLRDALRAAGIDAPDTLVRRNGDMPAVPGGIQDDEGKVIAPDPATLPPDELDMAALWRHPDMLFSQTCWGPMDLGLEPYVRVIAQPDYSDFEGGKGTLYSSAIVTRGSSADDVASPPDGAAALPIEAMRGLRLAYNNPDSMSGIIGLMRDLEAAGESLDLFSERIETGSHRASVAALAEGRADICAVDCRSWQLAQRFEPKAREVVVVGWTARRKGLPYIVSRHIPGDIADIVREELLRTGSVSLAS